ncbi:hypothetical protein SPLA10_PHROGS00213 [Salmonella phage SPLA10]|nr:hypothetical protein SPLA10_PHROGS00213 [Salmonella phage SPLA10]
MAKEIDKFYDEIRQSMGFGKDDHEGWTIEMPGGSVPLTLKGKQMVTPTREVLKAAEWDKYQPFHPLCENIRRRKSLVLSRLQTYGTARLRTVLVDIINKMLEIASDSDSHDKLTIDQREILKLFATMSSKTVKNITNLLTKVVAAQPGESELIAMGVRRSGTWKGEDYDRLATVNFPIMDEEHVEGGKVFGVAVTVRDKEILYKVLRFILPKIDEPEAYSYGTRSEIAPQFHCLMMSFHAVAVDLNRVTKLIGGIDKEFFKRNHILTTWSAQMPNLYDYKDMIPTLDGNDGEPNKDEVEKERAAQDARDRRKGVVKEEPREKINPFKREPRKDDRRDDRDRDRRRDDDRDDRRRSFRDEDDDRRSRRDDRDDRRRSFRDDDRRGRSRYDDDDDYYEDRGSRRRSFRDDDRRDNRDENGITINRRNDRGRDRYDDRYDRRDDRRGSRRRSFR